LTSENYLEGIKLFNARNFFAAHEVLEDVWRAAPLAEKKYWQGLIQVAVALHHRSTGNHIGAQSVMARAARNLTSCPADWHGIRIESLRVFLRQWLDCAAHGQSIPDPPAITVDLC